MYVTPLARIDRRGLHVMGNLVYAVLVDGDIDIMQEGKVFIGRHVKDLKKMDCGKVTVKPFASWKEANAFYDKKIGY